MTPRSITFLELAATEPAVVEEAVKRAFSPFSTLLALGYGGNRTRATQLCDAIAYYGWSTDHWESPLPELEPVRNFANWKAESKGKAGVAFEANFTKKMERIIARAPAAEFFSEANMASCADALASAAEDVPALAPWDGAVWVAEEKRLILFEVKSSTSAHARLVRQVEDRSESVRELEARGLTVEVVAVVGYNVTIKKEHRWVKRLTELSVPVLTLSEISLKALRLKGENTDE